MNEKIISLMGEINAKVSEISDLVELDKLRVAYLGKKGSITALLKGMKDLSPDEKKAFGSEVNQLKAMASEKIEQKIEELKKKEVEREIASMRPFDITAPSNIVKGSYHPITLVQRQCEAIFKSMGFTVEDYSEIVTDYECFESLNIPKHHPARDMQDTFYLSPEFLLRTQTSAGQIHVMENKKPPIKILSPGRVFRSDDDATHSPMFHQMEGLVVDKNITLCDLKGMLDVLVQKIYGEGTTTRLRPSYFPFTEPSVEVDCSCFACGGKGCSLCKGTGWIEVLGAGIVNKRVLENCGIDSEEYSGFAFGIGLERIAMLKYGINNIKLLFGSDLRVLNQINEK